MTKRELIEQVILAKAELPRSEVEGLVNAVFDALAGSMVRGERIEIRGFGSFIVKNRDARTGLNPKTGATVEVPAKRVPFFKAGKELRERVDAKSDPGAAAVGTDAPATTAASIPTGPAETAKATDSPETPDTSGTSEGEAL